jgi:pheromone shutdown-related protein TraB
VGNHFLVKVSDIEIVFVGTGHILEKSVREVEEVIEREKPDVIAVELCEARYEALRGNIRQDFSVKGALRGSNPFFILMQWLMAYVQRKMGEEFGVEPGAEMMAAINKAEEKGCEIALIDRPIQITLQRFWRKMKMIEKIKMVGAMLFAVVEASRGFSKEKDGKVGEGEGKVKKKLKRFFQFKKKSTRPVSLSTIRKDKDFIERITDDDVVSQLLQEFRAFSPRAAVALLDERDAYIAGRLIEISKQKQEMKEEAKIVAVVGAGHVAGIRKYLGQQELIPPQDELCSVPQKRFSLPKILGMVIIVAIAFFILLVILSGISYQVLLKALVYWIVINGTLATIGVIIAGGHPFSALTAFCVAWLTSLNPFLAAGWFAGLSEAYLRKPTAEDMKGLVNVTSWSEVRQNRLFKVILVAALANMGSILGTFIGAYAVLHVVGIDMHQIWRLV